MHEKISHAGLGTGLMYELVARVVTTFVAGYGTVCKTIRRKTTGVLKSIRGKDFMSEVIPSFGS